MHTLKRNAIVPYTQRQMFELVNGIEEYPRFLPWCSRSKLISRTDKELVAELEVNWKGIHKSFTTRNHLNPFDQIKIELVNGPLQRLDATWDFIPLDEHACKIALDMEFEFSGHFLTDFCNLSFSTSLIRL